MLTKKKIIILSIALFILVISLIGLFLIPSKTSPSAEVTSSGNPSATPIYKTSENKTVTATPFFPNISLEGPTLIPTAIPSAETASPSPTLIASSSASPSAFISDTPAIVPTASTSAVISSTTPTITPTPGETTLGRLSYMQGKDIYNTDLKITQLLVKNDSTPSGNFKWSPKGLFLSWVEEGTPSSQLVLYDYAKKTRKLFPLKDTQLISYVWSPDEKKIALLSQNKTDNLFLVSNSDTLAVELLDISNTQDVSDIKWLGTGKILLQRQNRISAYDFEKKTEENIVTTGAISLMSVSPDEKYLLYYATNSESSAWYLVDLTDYSSRQIMIGSGNSDLTSVNLPPTILEKGPDNKAVWFPSSDKIFLTVKYLREFPIVGIYDLSLNTFKAVSIFHLQNSDFMSDPYTLVGEREVSKNGSMESQINFFSIEGEAKLGLIKVIPNSQYPAFYSGE